MIRSIHCLFDCFPQRPSGWSKVLTTRKSRGLTGFVGPHYRMISVLYIFSLASFVTRLYFLPIISDVQGSVPQSGPLTCGYTLMGHSSGRKWYPRLYPWAETWSKVWRVTSLGSQEQAIRSIWTEAHLWILVLLPLFLKWACAALIYTRMSGGWVFWDECN